MLGPNETSDTPAMKVSNDFGKIFGPLLNPASNDMPYN
jgi:hypothetical protein